MGSRHRRQGRPIPGPARYVCRVARGHRARPKTLPDQRAEALFLGHRNQSTVNRLTARPRDGSSWSGSAEDERVTIERDAGSASHSTYPAMVTCAPAAKPAARPAVRDWPTLAITNLCADHASE